MSYDQEKRLSEDDLTQKPDTQSRELGFYSVKELEWLMDTVSVSLGGNNILIKVAWIGRISEALKEAREREEGLPFDV